jgi:hypothetical protein
MTHKTLQSQIPEVYFPDLKDPKLHSNLLQDSETEACGVSAASPQATWLTPLTATLPTNGIRQDNHTEKEKPLTAHKQVSVKAQCLLKPQIEKERGANAYRLALQRHRVYEDSRGDFGTVSFLVHPFQGHKARLKCTPDRLPHLIGRKRAWLRSKLMSRKKLGFVCWGDNKEAAL